MKLSGSSIRKTGMALWLLLAFLLAWLSSNVVVGQTYINENFVAVNATCYTTECNCLLVKNNSCTNKCNIPSCGYDGGDCTCVAPVAADSGIAESTVAANCTGQGQAPYPITTACSLACTDPTSQDAFQTNVYQCYSSLCSISGVSISTTVANTRVWVEVEQIATGQTMTVNIDGNQMGTCTTTAASCGTYMSCGYYTVVSSGAHTVEVKQSGANNTLCGTTHPRQLRARISVLGTVMPIVASPKLTCTNDVVTPTPLNHWVADSICQARCPAVTAGTAQAFAPQDPAQAGIVTGAVMVTTNTPISKHLSPLPINYTCSAEYKSTGQGAFWCINGVWSAAGSLPFCTKRCTSQPSLTGLNVASTTCTANADPGTTCNVGAYTCSANYNTPLSGTMWTCNGATGNWDLVGTPCLQMCTVQAVAPTSGGVLNINCPIPANASATCTTYTCDTNYVRNSGGMYTCTNGVWTPNTLCYAPCTVMPTSTVVTFFDKVGTNCVVLHNQGIPYSCISSNPANRIQPTTPGLPTLVCNNGQWPSTAGLCSTPCASTITNNDTNYNNLNCGNNDNAPGCFASDLCDLSSANSQYSAGACSQWQWKCSAAGAVVQTAISGSPKTGRCYAACSTAAIPSFIGTGAVGCAVRNGPWSWSQATVSATSIRHGQFCDVMCSNGNTGTYYRKTGDMGPLCVHGKWVWYNRRGTASVKTQCVPKTIPAVTTPADYNPWFAQSYCTTKPPAVANGYFAELEQCTNTPMRFMAGYRLKCNSGFVISGPDYIQCENGGWVWGNGAQGAGSCVTPVSATTCTLNSFDNAPTPQCANTAVGGTCRPTCKAGYTLVYSHDDQYTKWKKSYLTCLSTGVFDTAAKCVPTCAGYPNNTANGFSNFNTPGGCKQMDWVCDGFCGRNADDMDEVDCSGLACGYDNLQCSEIPATPLPMTVTITTKSIKIFYAVDRTLPSGAWVGLYIPTVTSASNFIAAAPCSAALTVGTGVYGMLFDLAASSPLGMYVRSGSTLPSTGYEIEARMYADGTSNYVIGVARLCGNLLGCQGTATAGWGASILDAAASYVWPSSATSEKFNPQEADPMDMIPQQDPFTFPQEDLEERDFALKSDALAFKMNAQATTATYPPPIDLPHPWCPQLPPGCYEKGCSCADYGVGGCTPSCNIPECHWDAFTCFCDAKIPDLVVTNANGQLSTLSSTYYDPYNTSGNGGGSKVSYGLQYDIGTFALFQCNSGSTIDGSSTTGTVRCTKSNDTSIANGAVWTASPCYPKCTTNPTASSPVTSINGCTDITYGNRCTGANRWSCTSGTVNSAAYWVCGPGGNWVAGSLPFCQTCPSNPTIANANTAGCTLNTDGSGPSCSVTCNAGFMWSDGTTAAKTISCPSSTWTWTTLAQTCVVACTTGSVTGTGRAGCPLLNGTTVGFVTPWTCDMTCSADYTAWSCPKTEMCTAAGTLSPQNTVVRVGTTSAYITDLTNTRCFASCDCRTLQTTTATFIKCGGAATDGNTYTDPSSFFTKHGLQAQLQCVLANNTVANRLQVSGSQPPYCRDGTWIYRNTAGARLSTAFQCGVDPVSGGGGGTPATPPTQCLLADLMTFPLGYQGASILGVNGLAQCRTRWNVSTYFDVACSGSVATAGVKVTCTSTPSGSNSAFGKWVLTGSCPIYCRALSFSDVAHSLSTWSCAAGSYAIGSICNVQCAAGYHVKYQTLGSGASTYFAAGAWCQPLGTYEAQWLNIPTCVPDCDCDQCPWVCPLEMSDSIECTAPSCGSCDIPSGVKFGVFPDNMQMTWTSSVPLTRNTWLGAYTSSSAAEDDWLWARFITPAERTGNSVTLAWPILLNQELELRFHHDLGQAVVGKTGTCEPLRSVTCPTALVVSKLTTPVRALPTLSDACLAKGCNCTQYNDSVCDPACNNVECNFDGNDCGCGPLTNMIIYGLGSTSCPSWSSTLSTCSFTCKAGYLVFPSATGSSGGAGSGTTTCRAANTNVGGAWDRVVCEATCPAIGPDKASIRNGVYTTDCSGATSRSTCAFTCNFGYYGVGATTCRNGMWDMQAQCLPYCRVSDLPNLPFGTYSCGNTTVSGTCNFNCNSGYTNSGSTVCQLTAGTDCLTSGWVNTAQCIQNNAPTYPNCTVADIHISFPGNYMTPGISAAYERGGVIAKCSPAYPTVFSGTVCQLECDRFYTAQGTATATCGTSGAWTVNFKCIPPCTVYPFNLPMLGGSTSASQCISQTSKVPYQSSCSDWACPAEHLKNEQCPDSLYSTNPTCTIGANNTMVFTGQPYCFRPCTRLDLWGYTADAVLGCSGVTDDGHIPHGQACTVVCQNGYTKIGTDPICYDGDFIPNGLSSHAQCIKNKPAPDATPCAFNQLTDPLNGKLSRADGWICDQLAPVGFVVPFNCNAGYVVKGGGGNMTCQGQWIQNGQCVPNTCAATTIGNATLQCPLGTLGQVCQVTCAVNFVLKWPSDDDGCGAKTPTVPVCKPTGDGSLAWANLPTCVEACYTASGCDANKRITMCDHLCSEVTSTLNCGGPSCNNDNYKCNPITGAIDYVEISSVVFHYSTSRRLGSSAWSGVFASNESANYFAHGRTPLGVSPNTRAADQWGEARFGSSETVRNNARLNRADGYVPHDPYTRVGDYQLRLFADAGNSQAITSTNITHKLVNQMGQEMVPIGTKDACDAVNATKVASSSITASTSFSVSDFNSTRQTAFRNAIAAAAGLTLDQVEILWIKAATTAGKAFAPQATGSQVSYRFINLGCSQVGTTLAAATSAVTSGTLSSVGISTTAPTIKDPSNPISDPNTVPFTCPGQAGATPTSTAAGLTATQDACRAIGWTSSGNSSCTSGCTTTCTNGSVGNLVTINGVNYIVMTDYGDRDTWKAVGTAFIILFGVFFFAFIAVLILLIKARSALSASGGAGASYGTTQVKPSNERV